MSRLFGTEIFWSTILSVFAIMGMMTLIGRMWSAALPAEYRQSARLYLSPVLGLATFVVIASTLGRRVPLGDTLIVPLVTVCLVVAALWRESDYRQAGRHMLYAGIFALLCGTSILPSLFLHGAFNAHNDAFAYLEHGNWLQHHSFKEVISAGELTPANTQVLLYQVLGFRMGGSYFLAFFQALLNLRWSYDAYPAVVLCAVASSCLAMGFPIARLLEPLRFRWRLLLLALPSFSFGGLVFGANFGFLAQTFGLALGPGSLFLAGPLLGWIAAERRSLSSTAQATAPLALLVSAAIFAYSEMAPFAVVALATAGLVAAVRFSAWTRVIKFALVLSCLILVLSNLELLRAYKAIRGQSGAVVGSPVDWSLLQFLAHAFGIQPGAWEVPKLLNYGIALAAICGIAAISTGRSARLRWKSEDFDHLIPVFAMLGLLALGVVYFRYFVASPFPTGTGQSWSQFKLTDWAHPSASVLVIAMLGWCLAQARGVARLALLPLACIALLGSTIAGTIRMHPIVDYYDNVADLDRLYRDFRKAVVATCQPGKPIFLALNGADLKFRQMAAVYLDDRELHSDWRDDQSIFQIFSDQRLLAPLAKGDCLIEKSQQSAGTLAPSVAVGPFRIRVFDGSGTVPIASVEGAHDQESEGANWWRWVEQKIVFHFVLPATTPDRLNGTLRLDYLTRFGQPLHVEILAGSAVAEEFDIAAASVMTSFSKAIEIGSSKDLTVRITSAVPGTPLGERDTRKAAFLVKNFSVSSMAR